METDLLWRLVAVAAIVVFFCSGTYLHLGFLHDLSRIMRAAGVLFGCWVGLGAISVTANVLAQTPITVGAKVFTTGAVTLAIAMAALAVAAAVGPRDPRT